ncbi:MAG TPA: Hsp20/alpha crystallin family protein [Acidobacteriota bacterium]
MQLTRFNFSPYGDLFTLGSVNRWFDQAFNRNWQDDTTESPMAFVPPVDVRETPEAIEFIAEVPGFEKDQIDIRVEGGNLTISGERKFEQKADRDEYHRVERAYGRFQRVFTLPPTVEADKIKATLKNGVLSVILPKSEKAKPRQIPVSVS